MLALECRRDEFISDGPNGTALEWDGFFCVCAVVFEQEATPIISPISSESIMSNVDFFSPLVSHLNK